jgi:beta-glucanase (GH16 family)
MSKGPLETFCGVVLVLLFGVVSPARVAGAQHRNLVWADEFDGPANTPPDASKWKFDLGGGGWGNNELESYTSRIENASLDGQGNLAIKAIKERYTGTDGIPREYTSARLLTAGKFAQRFGRFEARIKLPAGQGIWPAFWLLGDDISTAGWPACGEVDIMENIGREPSINHGSLHGPGYFGGNSLTGSYALSDAQRFSDDFHVFALEWSPNVLRFLVDGNVYESKTPADMPASKGSRWVFDHPSFMLLNVAVGGNWPGSPDDTTVFPQTMLVDYVRVYEDQDLAVVPVLISSAVINGKNLIVSGERFARGAVILMNEEPQTTKFASSEKLRGNKLARRIARGQTATIRVRNPDGSVSNEVSVMRR